MYCNHVKGALSSFVVKFQQSSCDMLRILSIAEHVANGINGSLHDNSATELAGEARSSWASGSIVIGGSGSSSSLAGALSQRPASGM
jgi:hypothetical protein